MPNGNYIDGAFFGTTFPHLYLQTFSEMQPQKSSTTYVPRVFGFKVHKVGSASPPAQRAPAPCDSALQGVATPACPRHGRRLHLLHTHTLRSQDFHV